MRYAIIALVLAITITGTLLVQVHAAPGKGKPITDSKADTWQDGFDRPDRKPVPQIVFDCLPDQIQFNSNDLILVCQEPLVIGEEIINAFSIRHNKRFSASAVALYTTAMTNGQWLLLTVDETNPLRDRCLDGCRRVNQVALSAGGTR